jgi:hypothetical protein
MLSLFQSNVPRCKRDGLATQYCDDISNVHFFFKHRNSLCLTSIVELDFVHLVLEK